MLEQPTSEEDLNTAWAEKAWIQTVAEIEKITGWRLDSEKTPSVEAVIRRINPDKSVSEGTATKAKHVFSQTLTVIQRTGAIVAPAAATVFGPSQQCFNAVSFIITAVQDYQSVYEQITALMERISVFLERFEIRIKQNAEALSTTPGGSRSDLPLMQPTYRVLEHFVTILGRVQKLTHGWKHKVKLFVKVGAFGEDGGVREALGKLETLVQDVTQTEISVIGRDLSGMAKDMREFKRWTDQVLEHAARTDATLGQLKSAKDREEERREMDKVRKKLGLDEKEPWKRYFEKLSEERVAGTGRWLVESATFRRWVDYGEPRSGVLALRGESKSGKSFLCRAIIEHLLDLYPKGREVPRASVGYYFLSRDNAERGDSLNDAIRAMIWQLVQSDAGYAKGVQKECDRDKDFPTTNDMWTNLVTALAKTVNATFYLVLDGIDDLPADEMAWVAESMASTLLDDASSGGLRFRILLSGRSKTIEIVQQRCLGRIDTIDLNSSLGEFNLQELDLPHSSDIERYILERNEWREVLNAAELTSDEEDFVKTFPGRLAASVQGNYGTLLDKLRRMEGCKDMEEIEATLSIDATNSYDDIVQRVENLTATLGQIEIGELNEILAWVSAGCDKPIPIKIIKQALSWRFNKNYLLHRTLTHRYHDLLTLEGPENAKTVRFASYSVEDYFMYTSENDLEIAARQASRRTEIKLIKQIIQTHLKNVFGSDDVYGRSDLDDFFQSKQHETFRRIHLSDSGSHTRLLEVCLAAMCDPEQSLSLNAVRDYAFEWFDRHLLSSDPNLATTEVTGRINHRLIRLLREPVLIERWWTLDRMRLLRMWMEEGELCDKIVAWLSDAEVRKYLQETLAPEENEWIQAAKADPRRVLFERVAVYLLNKWQEHPDETSIINFLRAYSWLEQGKAFNSWNYDDDFSVQDLQDFENWAAPDPPSSAWHLCMARSLLDFGFATEASERCQHAIELNQGDWRIMLVHVRALMSDKKYNTAMEKMETLVALGEPLLQKDDEAYATAFSTDIQIVMGRCFAHLERHQEASEAFGKVFERSLQQGVFDNSSQDSFYYLVTQLTMLNKYEGILDLLAQLKDRIHPDGSAWVHDVFAKVDGSMLATEYSRLNLDFHPTILCTARVLQRFEVVEQYYIDAKKHLTDSDVPREPLDDSFDLEKRAARLLVKLFHYKLIRYVGPVDRRSEALEGWITDLIDTELDSSLYNNDDCMFYLRDAADHAARFLLSESRVNQSTVVGDPEVRLKKLTSVDPMIARHNPVLDLRLILARLYYARNKKQTARHTLIGMMRSAINTILNDGFHEDVTDAFRTAGHILTVLEDDGNARIAFVLAAERTAANTRATSENLARIDSANTSLELTKTKCLANGEIGEDHEVQSTGQIDQKQAMSGAEQAGELPNGVNNESGVHEHHINTNNESTIEKDRSEDTDKYEEQRDLFRSASKDLGVTIPDVRSAAVAHEIPFSGVTTPTPGGETKHHRVSRDYISVETLRHYGVEYDFDPANENYLTIKQPLTALEKELMFEHTTQLRKSSEDGMRRSSFPETAGLEDMIHLVRDEELFASLGFSCSNCHKAPPDLKEWFVCRDCMDIALDPQCLVDRREESCGPGHSHMRLSLSDVKHCRSGNGEQLSDVTQWVRDLQREWMLDKPALRTFDDVLTLTLGVMAAKRIWKERKYGRNVSSVASSRLIPLATLLERPDIVGFKGRSG